MDKRQYDQAFDKFFISRKYSEALEVAGAMKYAGIPGARYMEMLVYYEQGRFEKIRSILKGKRIDNIEEREFYLASLIELMMYDEFESYYSEYDSISDACLNYITGLMRVQGHYWMPEHKAVMDYPTYFDRKYRWFVAEQMTDVFNLNEERLMLIDAGLPASDINELTRQMNDKLEMIIVNDAVGELIKKYIIEDKAIPVDNVLYLPLYYPVPMDKLDEVFKRYEDLSDIADYIELARRIHLPGVAEDAASSYWKEFSDAVHEGNVYMADIMAKLYADTGHFKDEVSFGMESFSDKVYSVLEKDAAFMISEIDGHMMNKDVEKNLSKRGLFAYRAAGWKLCNAIRNERDDSEVQVICLAFLRVLEYEINEKIIFPLCQKADIRRKYEEFKSTLNEVDKGEFVAEWEYKIACLEKIEPLRHKVLRFAEILTVLDALKFKRYKKDSFHREFAANMRAEVGALLTDEGKTALADGSLIRLIEPKKLELFRTPDTAVRYSCSELAIECRKFVEQGLSDLAAYVLPAGEN